METNYNLLIVWMGVCKFRLCSEMTVPFFCIFPNNQKNMMIELPGGSGLAVVTTTMQDIPKFISSVIGHCFHLQPVEVSSFCFFERFVMLAWHTVPPSVHCACHTLISVTSQYDNASLYHSGWALGNSIVLRCCHILQESCQAFRTFKKHFFKHTHQMYKKRF